MNYEAPKINFETEENEKMISVEKFEFDNWSEDEELVVYGETDSSGLGLLLDSITTLSNKYKFERVGSDEIKLTISNGDYYIIKGGWKVIKYFLEEEDEE